MSTQGLALRAASWSADMTTQRLSPRAGRRSLDKKPPASSAAAGGPAMLAPPAPALSACR